LQDQSLALFEDSPEVWGAQELLYPSDNLDDELSQKTGDSRESAEAALLKFLHRSSIYG
jgi:hypothetical protein